MRVPLRLTSWPLRAAALSALSLAAVLTSCSGSVVGQGTAPSKLYLGTDETTLTASLTECDSTLLHAYVVFTGEGSDSTGDYTDRVTWKSSDPGVVLVGDGSTLSPDGYTYSTGTLVGVKPGAATITATFLDMTASVSVQVSDLSELVVQPALTDIATQLPQQFRLRGRVLSFDRLSTLNTTPAWRLSSTTKATVDASTGLVTGKDTTAGSNVTLTARLPECGREVSTQFRVSPIASLELNYENGTQAALPLGFSEGFSVLAHFATAGATPQNLTAQVTLDEVDDDYLSATLSADGQRYFVTAAGVEGSSGFDVDLDHPDGDFVLPSKTWQTEDVSLEALTVSPSTVTLQYPATAQLTAIGSFSNGLQIPVSRHMTWASSDADFIAVSTVATSGDGEGDIGEVSSADARAQASITVSYISPVSGKTIDASATVNAFPH